MTALVSGGFDPLHVGHVRLIQAARIYGRVVVALNSDAWLVHKKGYVFMPWRDRREILMAIAGVYRVVSVEDEDDTVCEALRRMKPTHFCNGGDRDLGELRESVVCREIGIIEVFNVGGGKVESSSSLVETAYQAKILLDVVSRNP